MYVLNFREFLRLSEATFAAKTIKDLTLDRNAERFVLYGWEIWIKDHIRNNYVDDYDPDELVEIVKKDYGASHFIRKCQDALAVYQDNPAFSFKKDYPHRIEQFNKILQKYNRDEIEKRSELLCKKDGKEVVSKIIEDKNASKHQQEIKDLIQNSVDKLILQYFSELGIEDASDILNVMDNEFDMYINWSDEDFDFSNLDHSEYEDYEDDPGHKRWLEESYPQAVFETVRDKIFRLCNRFFLRLKRMCEAVSDTSIENLRDLITSLVSHVVNYSSHQINAHLKKNLTHKIGDFEETNHLRFISDNEMLEQSLRNGNLNIDNILRSTIYELMSKHELVQTNDQYKQNCLAACKKVLTALMSMNIRSFHRVPIVFNYQNEGKKSGWGNSYAQGLAYKNHVGIYGLLSEKRMITVLAHELGHIIYDRLNKQDQDKIQNMANANVHVRDYGKPDYVYQGLREPGIHHKKGNEWFATMIEYLATHPRVKPDNALPNSGGYTVPNQASKPYEDTFKQVRGITANAQNYGPGYKNDRPAEKLTRPPRRMERRKQPKK